VETSPSMNVYITSWSYIIFYWPRDHFSKQNKTS